MRRPDFSIRALTAPVRLRLVTSGFKMENVRSSAMRDSSLHLRKVNLVQLGGRKVLRSHIPRIDRAFRIPSGITPNPGAIGRKGAVTMGRRARPHGFLAFSDDKAMSPSPETAMSAYRHEGLPGQGVALADCLTQSIGSAKSIVFLNIIC